jgi:zinc/manganese transport system substrate-binding protein
MRTSFPAWVAFTAVLALATAPGAAAAKLRVAASITDLASIASSVGGDQVEVFAIARPNTDVHRVEVLPSYMIQVSRANLYLKVGLGLDQWADGIIDGSRNAKLQVLDCSRDITPLEKPTQVNASMGDVHPFGNPHYWLDPRNGAIVAQEIAGELGRLDPAHSDGYTARAEAFAKEVQAAYARDQQIITALPAKTLFTYHASWPYLAHAFGLDIVGTVEPVPGIPPTAKHLAELVRIAKERKVPLLLQETYFSEDAGKFLARQTGLRMVKVAPSCESPQAGSYLAHIEQVARLLSGASVAPGAESGVNP